MKTLWNWIVFLGLLLFVQVGRAEYSLVYQTNGDSISVIGYTGTPIVVDIPSKYNGYPVTEIADEAFYYCSSLLSVTVPEGVVTIGDGVFQSCTNLVTITLPSSLQSIGEATFEACESLLDPLVSS